MVEPEVQNRKMIRKLAHATAHAAGTSSAFLLAFSSIIVWAIYGFINGFTEGLQLLVNTGTTIITFLMMFLLQNSQNKDGIAIQLKLDELIKTNAEASNAAIKLEEASEEELKTRTDDMAKMRTNE